MKYIIHLEGKESPIHNYFIVTDSELLSYYFWRCCHGCQVYTAVGTSQRWETHLESRFLSSLRKGSPSLTGPPFWLSLISQERKITDFRALGLGLPLFFPFPLKMWHSLEKTQLQVGCAFHVFRPSRPFPRGTRFSWDPSCVSLAA